MAPHVITDFKVLIDAVDLSAWVKGLDFPDTFTEIDDSTMGKTVKVTIAGAEEWELSIDFEQDYAAGGPYATLWPKRGLTVAVEVRPTSAVASPTNPKFTGSGVLTQFKPIGGAWNEKHMTRAVIKCAGPLTVGTALAAEEAKAEAAPPAPEAA
jgi:hypothetical protein